MEADGGPRVLQDGDRVITLGWPAGTAAIRRCDQGQESDYYDGRSSASASASVSEIRDWIDGSIVMEATYGRPRGVFPDGDHILTLGWPAAGTAAIRRCDQGQESDNYHGHLASASASDFSLRSWSDLPKDLVEQLAEKITYHADLYHFGAVCKRWRCVIVENRNRLPRSLPLCHFPHGQLPLPLVMRSHTEDADSHEFLCLSDGKVYGDFFLPELRNKRIAGSSEGWFVTVDIEEENIHLFNPFTRAQVRLPSVTSFLIPNINQTSPDPDEGAPKTYEYVQKAILCSDPKSSGNNCVIVAIVSGDGLLSYCRMGDGRWTNIENSPRLIKDITYYKGKVYAANHLGVVLAFDPIGPNAKMSVIGGQRDSCGWKPYLVESFDGELLLVVRKANCEQVGEHVYIYKTFGFDVYKLEEGEPNLLVYDLYNHDIVEELARSEWVKVESIGGEMLFLGTNKSVSISSHLFPQCKGNCIYFTSDHGWESYYLGFDPRPVELHHDTGIYDMEDGSIRSYDPDDPNFIMPPVWVTPNPW